MSSGPLLSAVFDPSGSHLVSAVVALDSHKVRVQSTQPSNSALAHAFTLDKGSKLTSVSWGYLSAPVTGTKKQKTVRGIEQQIVAIGLNKGHVLLYSPTQNEVIAKLETAQGTSITDFHQSDLTSSSWSVDITGTIVEWDLLTFAMKQKLTLVQDNEIKTLKTILHDGKPHLLAASHSVYLVDPQTPEEVVATFPAHVSPIHTVLPITNDLFFTAASGDRFVNLYSISKNATQTVFVAQSNVSSIAFNEFDGHSVLVVVTEDGRVEVFTDALVAAEPSNKRRARSVQSRSANATIKLQRPSSDKTGSTVALNSAVVLENQIAVAWLEDASIPYFERISWLTGDELLSGDLVIEKARPNNKPTEHSLFGHDVAAPKHYNEGNAVVMSGDNFKDLENNSEGEEEGETLAEQLQKLNVEPKKKKTKAVTGSLTVVLSQALKANDHTLLETVLNNRDEGVIKNTIRRLDSALAVVLLNRLADKVSRQSSRQGLLNVWIKWIMVLHGGYMVSLPNLAQTLASLYSTLHRRAETLDKLTNLLSALDMLHSQVSLRREILGRATSVEDPNDVSGDSDVEYNEEWDDARADNLIDDGEEDFEDDSMDDIDMEQDDYDVEEESSNDESEDEDTNIKSVLDLEAEEDEGDSDVEVGVDYGLEMSESEDGEAAMDARVKAIKARK